MGMDVKGLAPKNETGEYFRRSVWGWRPLAIICTELCPDLTAPCEHWYSNDADGLDATQSLALAVRLTELIEDGTIATYCLLRDERIANLPPVACWLCHGTGVRSDAIGVQDGMTTVIVGSSDRYGGKIPNHPRKGQVGWCNACHGVGTNPDFETHYRLSPRDVAEIVAFLRDCGGFEIR